jgi:hypothetical protein
LSPADGYRGRAACGRPEAFWREVLGLDPAWLCAALPAELSLDVDEVPNPPMTAAAPPATTTAAAAATANVRGQ